MAKVQIKQEEIEKMLKDQLNVTEIKWNKDGSVSVEIDMDELKKKECCHHTYYYPTYVEPYKWSRPIYWTTSTKGTTLTYTSPGITTSTS